MTVEVVSTLGNDADTWRAEVERLVRRRDRLEEREAIQLLNWGMFGPRQDDTGRWCKPEFRAGGCGRPRADRVAMQRGEIDGAATSAFGGVETCASPWACGFCAAKIRGARAVEVGTIIRKHLDGGGFALFLTLTFSHTFGETAADTFGDAMDAWDRLVRSRPWKRLMERLGRAGFIRTTEITHSHRHSWHPHHHIALLISVQVTERLLGEVQAVIDAAWRDKAVKYGRRVHESAGVVLVPVRDGEGLGWYCSKVELELARGDTKRGYGDNRSPWQIAIEAVANGDAADFALWREYVAATYGRRSVSYSRGLLQRFGLKAESDDEKAVKLNAREVVALIPAPMYRAVARRRGLAELRRLLEGGQGPEELATAVERCLGKRVVLVMNDDDTPKGNDSGPAVPTLAFLGEGLPVEPSAPRASWTDAARAQVREWGRTYRATMAGSLGPGGQG